MASPSLPPATTAGYYARSDLRREEMTRFAAEMPWLLQPELIPEAATSFLAIDPNVKGNPFLGLAEWMINEVEVWSDEVHRKLNYGEVFEQHKLENDERVRVRDDIRSGTRLGYGVGICAISEIIGCIPAVATRDGKSREEWDDLAVKAKIFGTAIARNGVIATGLIRDYLTKRQEGGMHTKGYALSRVRLDDRTGITSVAPIEDVLLVAREMEALTKRKDETRQGECTARLAVPQGVGRGAVFGWFWNAYRVAATTYIFPHLKAPDLTKIPPQDPVNRDLRNHFKHLMNLIMFEDHPELGPPPKYRFTI